MKKVQTQRPLRYSMLLLLVVVGAAFSGCDPNNFNAQQAALQTLVPPTTGYERYAVLSCKRSGVSPINTNGRVITGSGSSPILNPVAAGTGVSDTASFHLLRIDLTPSISGAAEIGSLNNAAMKTVGAIRFTPTTIRLGADPADLAFSPNGNLLLASLKSANKVAAFYVGTPGRDGGAFRLIKQMTRMDKPSFIAMSRHGDFAFVVQEETNSIQAIDLTVMDSRYQNSANPFRYNEPIDLVPPSQFNTAKIERLIMANDPEDSSGEILLAAASNGGLFMIDVDTLLGREDANPSALIAGVQWHPIYNGVVGRLWTPSAVTNVAASPNGFLLVNGPQGLRTIGLDGSVILENLNAGPGFTNNRIDGSQLRDMTFAPNGSAVLAITNNRFFSLDARRPEYLGAHGRGLEMLPGNSRISVGTYFDPNFSEQRSMALVTNTQQDSVSLIRVDRNGKASFDQDLDTLNTKPYCDDPVVAAVQPVRGAPQVSAQPQSIPPTQVQP